MGYFIRYFNMLIGFIFTNNNLLLTVVKVIVILCLFMLCVLGAKRINSLITVNLFMLRVKHRNSLSSMKNTGKTTKYNFFILRYLDNKLSKNGRPLGLTATKYILLKVVNAFVIAIISSIILKCTLIFILIFSITGFLLLDLILLIDAIDNNKRIEQDLPVIINNLYMQLEANVPFVDCINTLYLSARNSRVLKEALKEFNIRFTMNDYNIEAACIDLEKSFSNVTLSTLLMGFRQYKDSGKMKEILKRQYELHLKKEEEMLENSSNAILKLAAISTILIGVNCILMIVYPMYVSMTESMSNVLK